MGSNKHDITFMKIDLNPSSFTSKDAYVRAALSKARDLAVQTWEDEHSERQSLIEREVASLSKPELAKRLIKLLSRPNRARAQISDSMRAKAQNMRKKGAPVREIAAGSGSSLHHAARRACRPRRTDAEGDDGHVQGSRIPGGSRQAESRREHAPFS